MIKIKSNLVNVAMNSRQIAIDIETTGLGRRSKIMTAAIAFADSRGEIFKVSFDLNPFTDTSSEDEQLFEMFLFTTLFSPSFKGVIIFHNMSFDLKLLIIRFAHLLGRRGDRFPFSSKVLCRTVDTLAMSRLLNPCKFVSHADAKDLSCHSLKYLGVEYELFAEDQKLTTFEDATGGLNIRLADLAMVLAYNELDAVITLRLYTHLLSVMSEREKYYLWKREVPHTINVFLLGWYGVQIDRPLIHRFSKQFLETMSILETEIYRTIGREFDITSQQQLSKALFNNPRVCYQLDITRPPQPIPSHGQVKSGTSKVDSDTLKSIRAKILKIDPHSNFPVVAQKIAIYLDLGKNLSKLETIEKFLVKDGSDYWVDPKISASAKSGRINCSSPPLLAMPKGIFKKNSISIEGDHIGPDELDSLWMALKSETIRDIIKIPKGMKLARIDVSGLDLVVLTWGAKRFAAAGSTFFWVLFLKRYQGKTPDPHFAILQELAKVETKRSAAIFQDAFGYFRDQLPHPLDQYFPMKSEFLSGVEGVEFIHRTLRESKFIPFPDDNGETKRKLEFVRGFSKKLNLATSYLIGAPQLAIDLADVTGEVVGVAEAQTILDKFYEAFPEIRKFQDDVGQRVYDVGFCYSPFGRRFYAETWGDFNKALRLAKEIDYELVIQVKLKWYYIRVSGWAKSSENKIVNLKPSERPFKLRFNRILEIKELDLQIFREPKEPDKAPKFKYKSEDQNEEVSEFELNRIAITTEIDRLRGRPHCQTDQERDLLASFLDLHNYSINEKHIWFYRVKLGDPASEFFKRYVPLMRSIKKFFPMYCQGIANSVAKTCLTHARRRLEEQLPESRVLFFIHDEIVVLIPEGAESEELAKHILTDAVENMKIKRPFDLPFTGKFKIRDRFGE
jgi:hypothetical protein